MVRDLRGIHGLGILFFLVLFFDHRRGHGHGRADEGFGITCLDEGLEDFHLPLGQLDL